MCVLLSGECTFEAFVGSLSHTCGWTQDTTDDFQWTRASGSTASYQTGPAFDHTYGTKQGKKCWIMIFFVSFYDKHPFDFDSPNVITSPILVSTPILSHLQAHQRLLRVIVVIISHIIGFFWSHIKKKIQNKADSSKGLVECFSRTPFLW